MSDRAWHRIRHRVTLARGCAPRPARSPSRAAHRRPRLCAGGARLPGWMSDSVPGTHTHRVTPARARAGQRARGARPARHRAPRATRCPWSCRVQKRTWRGGNHPTGAGERRTPAAPAGRAGPAGTMDGHARPDRARRARRRVRRRCHRRGVRRPHRPPPWTSCSSAASCSARTAPAGSTSTTPRCARRRHRPAADPVRGGFSRRAPRCGPGAQAGGAAGHCRRARHRRRGRGRRVPDPHTAPTRSWSAPSSFSTDAAAVFAATRGFHLRERLSSLLELESGLNDDEALLVIFLVEQRSSDAGVLDAIVLFAQQAVIGAALGIAAVPPVPPSAPPATAAPRPPRRCSRPPASPSPATRRARRSAALLPAC